MKRVAYFVVALFVIGTGAVAWACSCTAPNSACEANPQPGQTGCCGCGTLSSQCVVCDAGCTCQSQQGQPSTGKAKCLS